MYCFCNDVKWKKGRWEKMRDRYVIYLSDAIEVLPRSDSSHRKLP
jgi:hypothetical protein